jgi:tRNA:m(5)U-54 methyltransferase
VTATIVGGGLAGCEAAWALAERGVPVTLFEMRPVVRTPAHQTECLAELVCSNTFKSTEVRNAHGLLKAELRLLGSLLLPCADEVRVPGGSALAVDRTVFAQMVEARVTGHPLITVVREEGHWAAHLPGTGGHHCRGPRRNVAGVFRCHRADSFERVARPRSTLRHVALRQG